MIPIPIVAVMKKRINAIMGNKKLKKIKNTLIGETENEYSEEG